MDCPGGLRGRNRRRTGGSVRVQSGQAKLRRAGLHLSTAQQCNLPVAVSRTDDAGLWRWARLYSSRGRRLVVASAGLAARARARAAGARRDRVLASIGQGQTGLGRDGDVRMRWTAGQMRIRRVQGDRIGHGMDGGQAVIYTRLDLMMCVCPPARPTCSSTLRHRLPHLTHTLKSHSYLTST